MTSGLNGNKDPLSSDKMADAGVGRILKVVTFFGLIFYKVSVLMIH